MKLSELKTAVLDLLDATVAEDVFPAVAALERAINEAYRELVSKMEITAAPYFNVSPKVPNLVTPASPPREYDLASSEDVTDRASDIRKIVDVTRQYGPGTEKPRRVPIVSYGERNARVGSPRDLTRVANRMAPRLGVYFYRSPIAGAGSTWFMGFVEVEPPAATTFEIRYMPQIVALGTVDGGGDDDIPSQYPEEWHHLIAYRAAIRAKGQENRDARGLIGLYNEGLSDMLQAMTSLVGPIQSQVL